ncbi:MAG: A/G-specific adenine glycosylase [Rhodobacteraceae bacterium]|nr:A/G-specific adenine glycosylase [Paracoccaceae bacterium]
MVKQLREVGVKAGKDTSVALLAWYDANARVMPWRVSPQDRAAGVRPDPYRIWLSEVMLQQTTVAAVTGYFQRFVSRWPTVMVLADADDGDVMGEWAGLGYYARARNLLKCARVVSGAYDGQFPDTYGQLLGLPGIGPYTAAAIAAIAFDHPETVVDGNVERVMARLFNISEPLPAVKPALKTKAASLTPKTRPGDYAQAVMDLGATVCTVHKPACGRCPLGDGCAARCAGTAMDLPRRVAKKPKPTRHGFVYLAQGTAGGWVLERRPDKGLLGGMLGWPTSEWNESPRDTPPFPADWVTLPEQVRHTFTHFHLFLTVRFAVLSKIPPSATFTLTRKHQFRPSDLPTVMRKAYDLWHAS